MLTEFSSNEDIELAVEVMQTVGNLTFASECVIIHLFENPSNNSQIYKLYQYFYQNKLIDKEQLQKSIINVSDILDDLFIDFPSCPETFKSLLRFFLKIQVIDETFVREQQVSF